MIEPNDFLWGFTIGSIVTSLVHLAGRWCEHWIQQQDDRDEL